MTNPTYTQEQTDLIRHFVGSDSELTTTFNNTFGTCLSKSALRKKRQRLGISKTAEQFRVAWMCLIGCNTEEIERDLRENPPVDIYEEQKQLAAAKRLAGMGDGPVDIEAKASANSGAMNPWTYRGEGPDCV